MWNENNVWGDIDAEIRANDVQRQKYERNEALPLPTSVKKAGLGLQQLLKGTVDVLDYIGTGGNPETVNQGIRQDAPNTALFQPWTEIDRMDKNINLAESGSGIEDTNMATDMFRYAPDLLMAYPTGGASLTGTAMRGVARRIRPIQRLLSKGEIVAPSASKAVYGVGEHLDDVAQGLEAAFVHGDYRKEKNNDNIVSNFDPNLMVEDAAAEGALAMLFRGVKFARGKTKGAAPEADIPLDTQRQIIQNVQDTIIKPDGKNKVLDAISEMRNSDTAPAAVKKIYIDEANKILKQGTFTDLAEFRGVHEPVKQPNTAKPDVPVERSENNPAPQRKATAEFKSQDHSKPLEEVIKEGRKNTKPSEPVTLNNLEYHIKQLEAVDKTKLNEAQLKAYEKRLKEVEWLKPKALEATRKQYEAKADNMSDKQLRQAYRKVVKAKEKGAKPDESIKLYNEVIEKKFKERKPKLTAKIEPEAAAKTNEHLVNKLSQTDEFLNKDNPKVEAKKAIDEARNTEEYKAAVDDIIALHNKKWIEGNDGKAKKDWKDLTIKEKRDLSKEWLDSKENPTVAERVASSDMYNTNQQRMRKNAAKKIDRKNTDALEAKREELRKKRDERKQKAEAKQEAEPKQEAKQEPETKQDTTSNVDKAEAGKVVPSTFKFNKRDMSPDMADAQKGTSVKGKEATEKYVDDAMKGSKTKPELKADKEAFGNDNALAYYHKNKIYLRDWVNGKKTLDHEMLHYLTDEAYDNDPRMKKHVDAVIKEAIEKLDSTDMMPYLKQKLKNLYKKGDNQEVLVTIIADPETLRAFSKVKSDRPEVSTLLDSLIQLMKKFIDYIKDTPVENSVAHQMLDVSIRSQVWVGEMRAVNRDMLSIKRNASLTTDSPLQKVEPLASEFVKGVASRVWHGISKLYEYADKDSSFVNFIKDAGSGTLIHNILRQWEVKGIPVIKSVEELSNRMHYIDSYTQTMRGYTVADIRELLPKTKKAGYEHIAVNEQRLTDEIIGADFQALQSDMLERLIDNRFSKDAIEAERAAIQKALYEEMRRLKVKPTKNFNKAVEALTYQTLGLSKPKNVRMYAVNNANQLLYNYTNIKGISKKLEELADAYVSMKAMELRKPSEVNKLGKDAITEITALHKHSIALYKEGKKTGQYRKGYIGGGIDPRWEYQYMDMDTFNIIHNKEGWEMIAPAAEKGYIHARRRAAYLKYEKGAIPTNQYTPKGTKVYNSRGDMLKDLGEGYRRKDEKIRDYNRRVLKAARKKFKNKHEPLYNEAGEIVGLRNTMPEHMKRQFLGTEQKISNVIADNIMQAHREIVYNEIVNKVNDSMSATIKDAKSAKSVMKILGKEEGTLLLRGDSETIRKHIPKSILDIHYVEVDSAIREVLPKALKDTAYISKAYKDELIGYRNEFLSNNRHLQLMEMWWRDAVIHFKENVVKKNPVAMATNMIGNLTMLMLEGANPMFLGKELHRAKIDIDNMYKGLRELNSMELKLGRYKEGTKPYKDMQAAIEAKQKELSNMEAYKGITDGWYQSAIDDIYGNEHSSASPISKTAEDAYKRMIQKTGIKDAATADSIVKAGCDALMTQHSRSGRAAGKLISYSDYTSRLAMYRLKKSQGMSDAAASKMARDVFVDYRRQLPKELNALKVTGVAPFITWAFRMQPVLAKRALANPVKTSALYGTYLAMSDDLGFVGDVRVGGWLPQDAFADPSVIGGLPFNMAKGDMPYEAIVPKYMEYIAEGDVPKILGVNVR